MRHGIVVGILSMGLAAGAWPASVQAVTPPVVSADVLAGPRLTEDVQYRRGGRAHYPVSYRHRHRSNVGAAVATGAVLGLFGTLAAAAATPSYGYGFGYPYGYGAYSYAYPYGVGSGYGYGYRYGTPYSSVSYGYGYGIPAYRSYDYYPRAVARYGYSYPYRRAYYPRTYYGRAAYPAAGSTHSAFRGAPAYRTVAVPSGYRNVRGVGVPAGYPRGVRGYPHGRPYRF